MTQPSLSSLCAEILTLAGKHWVIWSNEHGAYWRPDRCGYTTDLSAAGRYERSEAIRICGSRKSCRNDGVPDEIMFPDPAIGHALDTALTETKQENG